MAGGTGTSGRKVRIAVVGLGFGAEFIPIHQRHPHVELGAICPRSPDAAAQTSRSIFAAQMKSFSVRPFTAWVM